MVDSMLAASGLAIAKFLQHYNFPGGDCLVVRVSNSGWQTLSTKGQIVDILGLEPRGQVVKR